MAKRARRLGLDVRLNTASLIEVVFNSSSVMVSGEGGDLTVRFADGTSWQAHFPFTVVAAGGAVATYALHAFVEALSAGEFLEVSVMTPGLADRYLDTHQADLKVRYLQPDEELHVRHLRTERAR